MPDYRLYFLNAAGHFAHVVDLDSENDGEAIELVEQHRDGRDMELWRRNQLVKKIPKLA